VTPLHHEARAVLERSAGTPPSALTAAAVRRDDLGVLALQRPPGPLHSVDDVEITVAGRSLGARIYHPRPGRLPAVLFLHGGGFVVGRAGYDAPLRELALASGSLVVTPTCRLAPEDPFPAAVEDALAAAAWLARDGAALGALPGPFAVAGDSSGANLAAVVTHSRTRGGRPPAFQLLIYPMLDATASSPSYEELAEGYGFTSRKSRWYFDQYLPEGVDRRQPRVSPLWDCADGRLPPTLVVTAELDPLRDDGERYAACLRKAGVEVELRRYAGMIHGFFQMTAALEDSRRLLLELGEWIRARSPRGDAA